MSGHLRVLLVEDDIDLATTVLDYLALENMSCDHAANGVAGINLARANAYDVMLLDINMPRMNGLAMCRKLREEGVDTPVLMLTARDTLDDKVEGFRAGTDDYLVKPFAFAELIVRLQALSRRRSGQARLLTVGPLQMDLDQRQVRREGKPLMLTPTGWQLLEKLMRHSPGVVSKSDLEQVLWPDSPPDSNAFKVHLYKLRMAVDKPFASALIHTVPGQGVRCGEAERSEEDAL
ncbi:Response regulator consisting of a CheY-like receiver domain and a winged-helix DNA-binding domain [Hahella chejuensis KCTC 2396]|uniref:Response regulator consisting of a CheY-like receiver domain and a winged-helix DNA-binding domain n=1 Tax=Hahella chejuensis (strain KCTC 2396) TaxID=349521 RepID=Q2SET4_HAHCH|nr:response regulator transcription factor [Hahella chejuensis]ABC30840.1 Response regulator consisting of a CheY-like receiver domain and a winged-helix DNA-binding domain [Hahella chejuensis KCTC 2396]